MFPDYRSRVLSHEAAHFLLGYLLGCPVVGYDLTIGAAHIDFAEAKLQKRLFTSQLSAEDVDQLGVISMAGVAAEAMNFDDVRTCIPDVCTGAKAQSNTTYAFADHGTDRRPDGPAAHSESQ